MYLFRRLQNTEKCDIWDSGAVSSGTKRQWITQGELENLQINKKTETHY